MKKLVVLPVVIGLLLTVFSAVPVSASPNDSSGKVLKVAVIGDSYSAGNGAGIYMNDNKDGSYHSANNWGHVYVDWLKEQGVKARFVEMLAYGGSVTDDLLCAQNDATYRKTYDHKKNVCIKTRSSKENKNPGNQIARIPEDTDIVLLTIGGNDVHFSDIVKQCFAAGIRNPDTCKTQIDKANVNLRESVDYRDGFGTQVSVKQKTETVLRALDKKLKPGAEVVLVGYPLLSTTRPYVLTHRETYSDGRPARTTKYPAGVRVRELGIEATKVQQEIVDEWNAQSGDHVKVTYVGSIASAFKGHEPDPSATNKNNKRWINEFLETETREVNGRVLSAIHYDQNNFYHPGITGHEKIAGEIAKTVGVPSSVHTASKGEPVDVVLVVDSTGSMWRANAVIQASVRQVFNSVSSQSSSARFAVTSYRARLEYGADYVSRVDTGFTTDISTVEKSFEGITGKEHAKDGARSTIFSGVNEALNLDWRVDARKIVIIVGDAPAAPEDDTGYTVDTIAGLSAQAGGVEVYAVDVQQATRSFSLPMVDDSMENLTQTTGGQTYTATSFDDIPVFMETAITDSLTKPSGWLEPTSGYVGETLTFDARGSYTTNGTITQYEWDTDGDGIYEETTTQGTLTRSFDTPINTTARVRVTDEAGYSAIATAPLYVTIEPTPQPEPDTSTLQDKPRVYEVLDEEAIALFPELAPTTKDASLPTTGTGTTKTTTNTTRLPDTGTQIGIPATIGIVFVIVGLVLVAVVRKRSRK